jgi:hypothetical protein
VYPASVDGGVGVFDGSPYRRSRPAGELSFPPMIGVSDETLSLFLGYPHSPRVTSHWQSTVLQRIAFYRRVG